MIDESKYEGHTPAPWKAMFNHPQVEGSCVVNDEDESNFGWTDGERILGPLWVGELTDDMPDTKLIADAPLLLAEVKQLREWKRVWFAEVKRLREQVRLAKEWVAKEYPCCLNTMDIFTEYIGEEE